MDNNRMSTADMLQYCEEALAWEDFGPIDIFFFESVKKILLGQCSAFEENEDVIDDLMGIERPVRDVELEPEYGKYADIYYGEEGDDDIPDYSRSKADEAFDSVISGEGFFDQEASADKHPKAAGEASAPTAANGYTESSEGAYTLSDGSGFTQSSDGAYTFSDATAAVSTAAAVQAAVGGADDTTDEVIAEIESAIKQFSGPAAAPAKAAVPPKPLTPPSVNITVGSETANMVESEFNDMKDTLAAAAAAAEKSMQKK